MKKYSQIVSLSIFNSVLIVSALIILTFFLSFKTEENSKLSLICNTTGAPDTLSSVEMKSILKGEKQRWQDGSKIVLAMIKTNTETGETIAKKVYNMNGDELNKYWLSLVFAGKAKAPQFFRSEQELIDYVASTKGAIGVITSEKVQGNFKTIKVGGKNSF